MAAWHPTQATTAWTNASYDNWHGGMNDGARCMASHPGYDNASYDDWHGGINEGAQNKIGMMPPKKVYRRC
jgi:hypothetical protein